ncbi:hypothetical protein BJV82DRAFT_666850 [Fennellomyces sp. T-0311]|nr:hypothetical protein BJV82DRAFT_666850 [Fennellomyces sp. T-0311]
MQLDYSVLAHRSEIDDYAVPNVDQGDSSASFQSRTIKAEFPPINLIDLKPLQSMAEKINTAIESQRYQDAIHDVTMAIDQTLQLQLLDLLDIRAFCHAKQGRRDLAIADTQKMIDYKPEMTNGYLRKGSIFSTYGQQKQAIETYEKGLENAGSDCPQIDQLETARKAAEFLNATCIDLVTQLPGEIASDILSRLPQAAIVTCLSISRTWRQRTLKCESLWKELSIDDNLASIQLTNMLPHIAPWIQKLAINSGSNLARENCFEHMQKGSFTKIQTIVLTAQASQNLRSQLIMLSIAFWETRHTLTAVSLDFTDSQNPITLADVLLGCSAVTKLTYAVASPMSASVGNISAVKNGHPLASLQLEASSIVGTDIESMLKRCRQVRRLIMNGCDPTVLNIVNTKAPNLEILGYNHPYQIEELQEKVPEITDTVLASLANIKTLRTVTFRSLKNVTGEGIDEFFRKADKGLTSVTLAELSVVKDNHMALLGELKCLKQIELGKLSSVTDQGIRNILDGECRSLEKLTVSGCCSITEECIQFAKQKVKTVA